MTERPSVRAALPASPDGELAHVFHRSVSEGQRRLRRSWPSLLATGAVGGIDVGVGVLDEQRAEDPGHGTIDSPKRHTLARQ